MMALHILAWLSLAWLADAALAFADENLGVSMRSSQQFVEDNVMLDSRNISQPHEHDISPSLLRRQTEECDYVGYCKLFFR